MRSVLRSSFFWQFSGGFLLGAVGLLTLQPGDGAQAFASHFGTATSVQR